MIIQEFGQLAGATAPVQSLYDELVAKGVRIELFPGKTSPYSGNGSAWACADWHHGEAVWRVYFQPTARAYEIYHELLHMEFKHVCGAPIMQTILPTDPHRDSVAQLNNDLDHAYVTPRQIETYPEAEAYWATDYTRILGTISPFDPLAQAGVQLQRKADLLRSWLVLPVAMPSAPITQRFREELVKNDWLAIADELSADVQKAGSDKARSAEAYRDALEFDFPPEGRVKFTH
ncbi:putative IrrE N-terminal-like domain-containing protein [Burkholderia cepacia]|uniref:hypothetical protein n=1 Tax=Burkholderia cepacia TaxID=292 RepID=UPI0039A62469